MLYSFTGGADGGVPAAGLIQDEAGNLYGTTLAGGDLNCAPAPGFGCGSVFKLKPNGKEIALYSFTGGADGFEPVAGVVQDSKGNLYGTAGSGGDLSCAPGEGSGCGVVFKVSPNGKETVLYSFGGGSDGASPAAGLIWDGKGNLYGTTPYGGDLSSSNPSCGGIGCGVVFKLTP